MSRLVAQSDSTWQVKTEFPSEQREDRHYAELRGQGRHTRSAIRSKNQRVSAQRPILTNGSQFSILRSVGMEMPRRAAKRS